MRAQDTASKEQLQGFLSKGGQGFLNTKVGGVLRWCLLNPLLSSLKQQVRWVRARRAMYPTAESASVVNVQRREQLRGFVSTKLVAGGK